MQQEMKNRRAQKQRFEEKRMETTTKMIIKNGIDMMLREEDIDDNGQKLAGIFVTRDKIVFYEDEDKMNKAVNQEIKLLKGEKVKEKDAIDENDGVIGVTVSGHSIIDTRILGDFTTNYPRLSIIRTDYQTDIINVNGEDETVNEAYYVIVKYDTNAIGFTLTSERLFLYKGALSEADTRQDFEKMAELQISSTADYCILELHRNRMRVGMINTENSSAYGLNDKTGEYIKLGVIPASVLDAKYLRKLEFESKLGYSVRKQPIPNSANQFIITSSLDDINLDYPLRRLIEDGTPGIIILDSLQPSDLVNSDGFGYSGEIKMVFNASNETIKNKNPNIMILQGNKINRQEVELVKSGAYNIVISTEDKIPLRDILDLARDKQIILNKPSKDTRALFNSLERGDIESYGQLIDSTLYVGSIYQGTGLLLNETARFLLKNRDFYSLGEAIDDSSYFYSLLNILTVRGKDDVEYVSDMISIVDSVIKIVINGTPTAINDYNITEKQLINFLWKITTSEEQSIMITTLIKDRVFSTIYEYDNEDGEVALLKITAFKTEKGMDLKVTRITPPDVNYKMDKENDARVINVSGTRASGKTTTVKSILNAICKGKKVLILDEDYDIDEKEFPTVHQTMVIRDQEKISEKIVRNFDPDVLVLSTQIKTEKYLPIISTLRPDSKLIMESDFELINSIYSNFIANNRYENLCMGTKDNQKLKDIFERTMGNTLSITTIMKNGERELTKIIPELTEHV